MRKIAITLASAPKRAKIRPLRSMYPAKRIVTPLNLQLHLRMPGLRNVDQSTGWGNKQVAGASFFNFTAHLQPIARLLRPAAISDCAGAVLIGRLAIVKNYLTLAWV